MYTLWQDMRFGARMLIKNPLVTLANGKARPFRTAAAAKPQADRGESCRKLRAS